MKLRDILGQLFSTEETDDLEGRTSIVLATGNVLATGEYDIKFSPLPPLPQNGMYYEDDETKRYWVEVEFEGHPHRHEFKTNPSVKEGQYVQISYVPSVGNTMTVIPDEDLREQ